MTDTAWSFVALGGLVAVFLGNLLRARRTDDMGCLGHLFVASDKMTPFELVSNRTGIAAFFVGVVLAIALQAQPAVPPPQRTGEATPTKLRLGTGGPDMTL